MQFVQFHNCLLRWIRLRLRSEFLNKKRGSHQWQRRVEAKRVLSISKFIEGGDNLVANSAILYAQEHQAVSVNSGGTVSIDFSEFLHHKENENEYSDFKGGKDLRPIWLIDGQHRTRGLAQSETGIDLEIPIILFPPDFLALINQQRFFSEINTLQKELSPLHTLYMQHRFSIPSPIAKRDFSMPYQKGDRVINKNSRANHLAYECAAYLASNDEGPLFNRIKILDQNASGIAISQASQWVDYSRGWFAEGSIYGPDCGDNQKDINTEVGFYKA